MLLIGFIVILLISIPATLWLLKTSQDQRSHANPATTLSFTPTSSQTAPISNNVGDTIPIQVAIDPSTNLVTSVKVYIQYDPTKLSAPTGSFTINKSAFPQIVDGPNYTSGLITASVSVGSDATNAIQSPTTVGTIQFTALAPTDDSAPTQVTITSQSEVLSSGTSDQSSENVLLPQSPPAFIAIAGAAISPTITTVPTETTVVVTQTPTPTATEAALPTPTTTIIVGGPVADTPTTEIISPSPTLAQTGSTNVTFGVAAVLTVVTVIGGIILFVL